MPARWSPAGAAPGFADAMLDICAALGVDILLPTVDAELEPLAAARAAFAATGTDLLSRPPRRWKSSSTSSSWPGTGLDEEQVPAALLTELAAAAVRADALIQVNEKWRCPTPRTVTALARAGVKLVAGSDSHHCRDIGGYDTVERIMRSVSVTALRSRPSPYGPGHHVTVRQPAGSTPVDIRPGW